MMPTTSMPPAMTAEADDSQITSDKAVISSVLFPAISRAWAGPSSDTFDVAPIAGFVRKYLMKSKISIDPFARNKRWATHTNDLNPETAAESHMDAEAFLRQLKHELKEAVKNKDLLFVEMNWNAVEADIERLDTGLDRIVPHATCVSCQGKLVETCKLCKGRGVTSKFLYDTAPAELKKIREGKK